MSWLKRRKHEGWRVAVAAVGVTVGATGATGVAAPPDTTPPSTDDDGRPVTTRCIVRLHGKSGAGGESYVDGDGITNVLPEGNAEGWGGRQWVYFPDDQYDAARTIVAEAIEATGCEQVLINGFSNGASFAAKLYCRGETFGNRLLRIVIDDPVPDAGVLECTPDPSVDLALYWTSALASTAKPGWQCSEADWTCEGGETIGIEAYAEALGVDIQESPFTDHVWYWDAPELKDWSVPDSGGAETTDPTEPTTETTGPT